MFGGKQGHYARWHVHLWVSLPCRLSPAELGVRCFTVNGVEHVIYQFISFVDDIGLAVAASFCSRLFLVKEEIIPDPLVVSCAFSP